MKKIKSKMNGEKVGFTKNRGSETEEKRPTTFWFYSKSEENINRLANHLREDGLKIEYCGPAASGDDLLLIAEKWMLPAEESTEKLWNFFNELANQFGVKFDGWETRMDLDD